MSLHPFRAPPDVRSLVEAMRGHAQRRPDHPAYTFSNSDGSEEVNTYAQLDTEARALAARLQAEGMVGERAVLLYPPGLDYIRAFWACLYAGVAAVPAYPPDPTALQRSLPRLLAIIRDARPKAMLTAGFIRQMAQPFMGALPELEGVRWFTPEHRGDPDAWRDPGTTRDDLCFLQYTSGSTGDPKGVMLGHGTLLDHLENISEMHSEEEVRGVLWLPPYHDMGLIGGIIFAPWVGGRHISLSPLDFLTRPMHWLELISRHRGNSTAAPNFAYDLCVRKATPKHLATLDLSCWVSALNGAEPVRADTMRRFTETFGPCGFRWQVNRPCYGLAENALVVTTTPSHRGPVVVRVDPAALAGGALVLSTAPDAPELVSSGRKVLGQGPIIVDPDTSERCPDGVVGEIRVTGPSLAHGYWGRPELTEEVFRTRVVGDDRAWLRTGDLGAMIDGELFVTGRIKDLIIINGANVYPQDVERLVDDAHPLIRPGCTAAFAVEREGSERLALVTEVGDAPPEELPHVAEAIRKAIAEAMAITPEIIAFLPKRHLPKTSSGKVQRRTTREELLAGTLEVLARFDTTHAVDSTVPHLDDAEVPSREALVAMSDALRREAIAALVVREIRQLHPDLDHDPDPEARIRDLGLDSLMVVDLLAELEERLGVVLPMEELARGATLRQLVDAVNHELSAG